MASNNGQPLYSVISSQVIADKVRRLHAAAKSIGLSTEFIAAFKVIERNLIARPRVWGNQLFDYHLLDLEHFYKHHWMLIVDYGIHEPTRTVHIQNVRPYPGTSLDTVGSP